MFKKTDNQTYRLKPINEWEWPCFPAEVVKVISDAELSVARLDEATGFLRHKTALRRSLVLTESICSMRIAGQKVTHRDVLSEGFKRFLAETETGFSSADSAVINDANPLVQEALSLIQALHRTHRLISASGKLTVNYFVDLHNYLALEAGYPAKGLRQRPLAPVPFADGYFYPPLPEEIEPLLKDIVDFCNAEECCSTIVAAIAHFYMEAVVPFEWGNDRMGRMLAHAIYSQRHMWKHVIFPIGALPAIATKQHALTLLPYMSNKNVYPDDIDEIFNNWIIYCGQSMRVSAHLGSIYSQRICEMNQKWLSRLGELRRDSVVHIILDELPTTPVFNVPYLAERTGKSFSSVNEAITHLLGAGIVSKTSHGKRNRVFEASDVLDFYTWLEGQILPRNINAREAYLSITQ